MNGHTAKRWVIGMMGLAAIATLYGCATHAQRAGSAPPTSERTSGASAMVRADRKLVWKAHLSLEVRDIPESVKEAVVRVEQRGGFVEQTSTAGEGSARLVLRVPTSALQIVLSELEALGTVAYRNITDEDVTERFVDLEARLKNKIVLRDRLRQLLEKATEIKDILAIETELIRVQANVDSMEGQIRSLQGRAEYAVVHFNLTRRIILGPFGLLFKGLWWGIEKLFVIR